MAASDADGTLIPVFIPDPETQRPKHIGVVAGSGAERAFLKNIDATIHIQQTPRCLCSDETALLEAQQAGAHAIEAFDRRTGRRFHVRLSHFFERGHYYRIDFGHNPQRGAAWVYVVQDDRAGQLAFPPPLGALP